MAITTYSALQSAITDWLERSDLSGKSTELIDLAEKKLNRRIAAVETDAALTGTAGSRSIDISTLSVARPIALWDTTDGDEEKVTYKADGSFAYDDTSGEPSFWTLDGDMIDFDRPLSGARTFRFRFRQRFKLSDAAPTNWLLDSHNDIYLLACQIWGATYTQDLQHAAVMKRDLETAIMEVNREIAARNRGTATVDPGLSSIGRMHDDRDGYE